MRNQSLEQSQNNSSTLKNLKALFLKRGLQYGHDYFVEIEEKVLDKVA